MISRSAASLVAAALLASASAAMLTAQAPGRVEVRALVGAAVPLGPSEFSDRWNPGPGGAISVGYAALARTTISAEFGYSRYPEQELALPTGGIPGQFGARSSPTTLWSAWLDGAQSFRDGGIRPRLHGGIGAVAFGATRTGLGLRLGAGVDVPIASRLAMVFDATFAHAFVSSGTGYALDTSYSYLPLRVGVSWQ